jgi:hypothetical protein
MIFCRCFEPNRLIWRRKKPTDQINRIQRFGEQMHVPTAFREEDQDAINAMMQAASLCQFVTATAGGPIATPLPMIIDSGEGEYGTLYGHLAKANPQWQEPVIGDALAIFMGADAYVTPSWYVSKQEHGIMRRCRRSVLQNSSKTPTGFWMLLQGSRIGTRRSAPIDGA